MDRRRWELVQAAFEEIVELDGAGQISGLEALGSTDPALRQAVKQLLAADAEADQRLAPLEAALLSPAPAPDPLNLTGRAVSHFRVLEPLGAGGMGVVYRAEDTRLGRVVALKFLLPLYSLDTGAKVRFLQEARSAAALDHPNLCTVHEVGESEDGRLFLAMALYAGETLKARLDREGALLVGEAVDIARQIAQGLACAHAAGIVHRDLKPGNVMLVPGGPVKILDFGLAKARDKSLSAPNARLGTASYMAPEQVRGEAVDGRADLWALGAVFYEMLTGKKPFAGEHEVAIAYAILHDEPVLPSTYSSGLSPGLEEIVLRLLQKDPAMRDSTADALLAALAHVGTTGVRSERTRRLRTSRTFSGKRRWTLAVGVVGAVVIVAAAFGAVLLEGRSGRAQASQPEIVQLTFTGNARTPALSADGQRLAYSTRQCGADGRCTVDVIVQDMEGAGRATVARGLDVFDIQWTADGRYLLINGQRPGIAEFGPYAIASLGGAEPRYLGCCRGVIVGNTDTALVTEHPGSDSANWVRWVTMADGVTHDSLMIRKPRGVVTITVDPVSGGRMMLGKLWSMGDVLVPVLDRSGRVIDSLRLKNPGLRVLHPSPDGRGLLVGRVSEAVADPGEEAAAPLDLVKYPLGSDGHIGSRRDTVAKGLKSYSQAYTVKLSVAGNGTLTYASGSTGYELWLLRPGGRAGLISARRRVAAATGYLDGKISPDGKRLGILRGVVLHDRQLKQFSIMSSDSGLETPIGSPEDVAAWEWSSDGSEILLAVGKGDSLAIGVVDVSGGASRVVATMANTGGGATPIFAPVPGGGLVVSDPARRQLRRIGVPGLADGTVDIPHDHHGFVLVSSSPDGRSVAIVGMDRKADSMLVSRLSLVDGHADRLAAVKPGSYVGSWGPAAWLPDGSLIVSGNVNPLGWYRVPAHGGRPVRLGDAPWSNATYSWSADGRRILATVPVDMSDVYAIRNFSQLLNR